MAEARRGQGYDAGLVLDARLSQCRNQHFGIHDFPTCRILAVLPSSLPPEVVPQVSQYKRGIFVLFSSSASQVQFLAERRS